MKSILWDLGSGNSASTFEENEFDYREKPRITILPISAHESSNAENIFRSVYRVT